MRCSTKHKLLPTVSTIAVLWAGGFFSSLRGAVYTVTPATMPSVWPTLKPGDVCILQGGTYSRLSSTVLAGTSWSSPITLKSAPGVLPVVQSMGLSGQVKYLIFEGIKFIGPGGEVIWIDQGAGHIRISNCEVTGSTGTAGIGLYGSGGFNEVLNCKIHHNGGTVGDPKHGIYCFSAGNLIQGNEIYSNVDGGIHFYKGGVPIGANTVRQNYIHDNSVGIFAWDTAGSTIELNRIENNKTVGISVNRSSNTKVDTNTIKNTGTEVDISNSSGVSVTNNCVDPAKIKDLGSGTVKTNNCLTCCGGAPLPPAPTNINVTQTQPPVYQPSGPSTSQVAMPFLIAGVIAAALLLGSD